MYRVPPDLSDGTWQAVKFNYVDAGSGSRVIGGPVVFVPVALSLEVVENVFNDALGTRHDVHLSPDDPVEGPYNGNGVYWGEAGGL